MSGRSYRPRTASSGFKKTLTPMLETLQFEFMRNALMASLLVSVACGIIGTYVVVKRMSQITGGIAHAAFGGIGLGFFLKINPLICSIESV